MGPVLTLDDVIGTKVRALAGRGLPRDLIDTHAASRLRTSTEYGLTPEEISDLRRWAQVWSDDINRRLFTESYGDGEADDVP